MIGAYGADDDAPRLVGVVVDVQAVAERAAPGPILRRRELLDEGDTRRASASDVVEHAAGDEPDVHRREVPRRRGAPVGVRQIAAAHGWPRGDVERTHVVRAAEWQ